MDELPAVVVRPGGRVQEILACGHDVSNRDTALESGTVFCRLCELMDQLRDSLMNEKSLVVRVEQLIGERDEWKRKARLWERLHDKRSEKSHDWCANPSCPICAKEIRPYTEEPK